MTAPIHKALRVLTAAGCLAVAAAPRSAQALPEAEVNLKLDSILMLMAVDNKGEPRAVPATVDDKAANAYLAAMSIAAAEEITAGKRYRVAKQEASTLRFAPVSLAKFFQLLQPRLQKNPKQIGVIAPDPAQIKAAETLLIAQNVPAEQAKTIANQQPMVFCPEPALLVSFNEGPEKGQQFVPCATEANFVESLTQRARKDVPQLANTNLKVVAIPLNSFVALLRQEPAERVGQLRVVPSGRLVQLVQQLNQQKPPAAPAKQPAPKPGP